MIEWTDTTDENWSKSMDANQQKIAVLESRIDHLETELSYLDRVLTECGFPEGIVSLKFSAEEILREKQET